MGTKLLSLPNYVLRNVSSNFKEQILNLGLNCLCQSHRLAVNPKLCRITKTVFKGKSLGKRFVPKNVCTKTKFTAYCEEYENYENYSVECISVHQVG